MGGTLARQERVAERIVDHLVRGDEVNEAITSAGVEEYPSYRGNRKRSAQRVRAMMKSRPVIQQAIAEHFSAQGMSMDEATRLHIDLMRGVTREVILADGTHDSIKMPPSLKAIENYQKLVFPQTQTVKHTGTVGLDLSASFKHAPIIDVTPLESGEQD